MDPSYFDATQAHLDALAESIDSTLELPELETLRAQLSALKTALGQRYGVSLNLIVEVFDDEKERGLPLLRTELATSQ